MKDILVSIVEKEIKDEESKLKAVKQRLGQSPEGSIKFKTSHGRQQYEFINEGMASYLSNKKTEFIRILSQKKYDELAINYIKIRLKLLNSIFKKLQKDRGAFELINKIPKPLRNDIITIAQTDDEYARRWENLKYEGKEIKEGTITYLTLKKERVRSKAELNFANIIHSQGIPYRYEFKYIVVDDFGRPFAIYPDFTVLNKKGSSGFLLFKS